MEKEVPKEEATAAPLRSPMNLHNVPIDTKGLLPGDIYKTLDGALMIFGEK
tara:strand:+ start:263 stop:415 length:153 start_codon:yes stop_codon:yes gene_type:complete